MSSPFRARYLRALLASSQRGSGFAATRTACTPQASTCTRSRAERATRSVRPPALGATAPASGRVRPAGLLAPRPATPTARRHPTPVCPSRSESAAPDMGNGAGCRGRGSSRRKLAGGADHGARRVDREAAGGRQARGTRSAPEPRRVDGCIPSSRVRRGEDARPALLARPHPTDPHPARSAPAPWGARPTDGRATKPGRRRPVLRASALCGEASLLLPKGDSWCGTARFLCQSLLCSSAITPHSGSRTTDERQEGQ